MIDAFEDLLSQLGKILHLSLHLDKHHACSIQIREGLVVQLQLDVSQENLTLFSKVTEIPPGKFREEVLKEALKANGQADPRIGVFGYLAPTNHLVLFQRYPLFLLTGERLANLLGAFYEWVALWKEAIEKGQTSPQISAPKPFGPKL